MAFPSSRARRGGDGVSDPPEVARRWCRCGVEGANVKTAQVPKVEAGTGRPWGV